MVSTSRLMVGRRSVELQRPAQGRGVSWSGTLNRTGVTQWVTSGRLRTAPIGVVGVPVGLARLAWTSVPRPVLQVVEDVDVDWVLSGNAKREAPSCRIEPSPSPGRFRSGALISLQRCRNSTLRPTACNAGSGREWPRRDIRRMTPRPPWLALSSASASPR